MRSFVCCFLLFPLPITNERCFFRAEMYGTNSENDTIPLETLMTDYLFTCPSRRFLALSNYTHAGQWLYFFNHTLSFPGWGPYWYCQDYCCHGAELPFVFVRLESNANAMQCNAILQALMID